MSQGPAGNRLADQLRDVKVGLRRDLDITRQVMHGKPCYVLRDGISFQSHSLSARDYHIVLALRTSRTVGEAFKELVNQEKLKPEREDEFYQFVVGMHQRGLLQLPTEDPERLYARLKKTQSFSLTRSFMQLISLKVPMGNPDRWLDQVLPFTRFLFRPWFVAMWAIAVLACIAIIAGDFARFQQPWESLLAVRNVVLTLVLVLVLKVWHELGHALSCKYFGGSVPEWGSILIVGTPCAYVDTSAAWGFHKRFDRIAVNLAGIYFESLAAIAAVIIWMSTEPGLIHAAAHQTILIATVVTFLFNLNPLMKFDGYYVLSDWLGLPNLKQLADRAALGWVKQCSLGMPARTVGRTIWEHRGLVTFGLASAVYKTTVIAGLFVVIAYRLPMVGLAAGAAYVAASVLPWGIKVTSYLWMSRETAEHRVRAVTAWFALFCMPLSITIIPWSDTIHAKGVIKPEHSSIVRAMTPGFLDQVHVKPGDHVDQASLLCSLVNPDISLLASRQECETQGADVRRVASLGSAREPNNFVDVADANRNFWSTDIAAEQSSLEESELDIFAEQLGVVLRVPADEAVGKFFRTGEPLMEMGQGAWQVKTLVTAEQLADFAKQIGDPVILSFDNDGSTTVGTIKSVSPFGDAPLTHVELTHLAGGDIVVDPETMRAEEPYFEVTISLEDWPQELKVAGRRVDVRLPTTSRPLAAVAYRRWLQFLARYHMSSEQ